MNEKLPISVIIPMLNCAHRLEVHLERASEWIDAVEEIVVVDSYSIDGSFEVAKSRLAGFPTKFVQHPKGLYESWNCGVRNATRPYVYFSTVGDTITYAGLKGLLDDACRFGADVVISPPRFEYSGAKAPPEDQSWPIHDIINYRNMQESYLMDAEELYNFVMIYGERAVLGSSASNLYQREALHEHPFSGEYWAAGDSAWLIENNFNVKVAIRPTISSTFLYHEKDWSYSDSEKRIGRMLRCRLTFRAICVSIDHQHGIDGEVAQRVLSLAESSIGADRVDVQSLAELCEYLKKLCRMDRNRRAVYTFILQRLLYIRRRELDREIRVRYGLLRYLHPSTYTRRRLRKESKRQMFISMREFSRERGILGAAQ